MTEPTIVITRKADGRIQAQANVQDLIVIYGMLEMGKDAIREALKQGQSGIVPAAASDIPRAPVLAGK